MTDDGARDAHPRRRRLFLAAAAIVVLAGGGTTAGVLASGSGDPSPSSSSTSPSTTTAARPAGLDTGAVAAWLTSTVASSATVVSDDADLARDLSDRGRSVTTVDALAAAPPGSYLLTTRRPDTDHSPVAVDPNSAFVPVARFARGDESVEVGQIVPRSADTVAGNQATAADTARTAAAGLLDNPRLTVAPAARAVLEAGRLDVRAAALLALLAAAQPVRLEQTVQDPAEAAVGLPTRVVVVAADDRAALQGVATGAKYPFAPTISPGTAGSGSLRLTWPLLSDPDVVVS